MHAVTTVTVTSEDLDEMKMCLKATWMTGDRDRFSLFMKKDAELSFRSNPGCSRLGRFGHQSTKNAI